MFKNDGQKTKVKGKCEESTAKQSILGCILLQRKHLLHVCRRTENFMIIIGQETQNQTWLPYYNWNYVNIYLHYQYDISVIVARMSLPWNFHSNKEQLGWLYSQAMVRFYAVRVRMKGTWWGIIFKILVGFWFWGGGAFSDKGLRYLWSHFSKLYILALVCWSGHYFFMFLRPEKANACLLWPQKHEKVMPDCCAG